MDGVTLAAPPLIERSQSARSIGLHLVVPPESPSSVLASTNVRKHDLTGKLKTVDRSDHAFARREAGGWLDSCAALSTIVGPQAVIPRRPPIPGCSLQLSSLERYWMA